MIPMITKEDILKAAEICTMGGDHGELCPNCPLDNEKAACVLVFAEYIKENEPALSANSTSSEVSDDTCSILQFDDSTKDRICQEAEKAYKACELILEIYERMDDSEQKAFDLGQSYRAMVEVKKELARIGKGGVPNA